MLADIGDLQMALLADVPARVGSLATAVAYRPASGPGAGGDFFDVFELADGQVAALIGDVSGHGQRALAQTAFIHYGLRAWLQDGLQPRQALKRAAESIGSDLEASFVTALICVYHPREHTLTWASAGHPPPLLEVELPIINVAAAPPVGMGMRSGQRQTVVSLPESALVCLYTDGLTEASTAAGRLGEDHLRQLVQENKSEALSAEALLDAVAASAKTINDDMATVLLRVEEGAGTKCEIIVEELEISADEDLGLVTMFAEAAGLSEAEIARALVEIESARGREYPVLLRVLTPSHTFEVASEYPLGH